MQERPCGHVWWPLPREVRSVLSVRERSEGDCWEFGLVSEGDWRGGLGGCEEGLRRCEWAVGLLNSASVRGGLEAAAGDL